MGILVREVERCLDAYLFLDEYPRWESGGPHCPYILQWMFAHMETAEQKEYDCRIWQGHQQSMPKWDASVEVPTIDLVGYKTTQEEDYSIIPWGLPIEKGPQTVPGDPKVAEEILQETLNSLKECLQCRWGSTQPEEPEQGSAGAPRSDPWSNFQQRTEVT